jgi:ketosteroid isomerase-like protein
MRSHFLLVTLSIFSCILGCKPKATGLTDEDKISIENQTKLLIEQIRLADYKNLEAIYDPYCVVMSPVGGIFHGLPDFKKRMQFNETPATLTHTSQTIVGDDCYAFVHGFYFIRVDDAEGMPIYTDEGRYMKVWKKQTDGVWKLYRDVLISGMPEMQEDF